MTALILLKDAINTTIELWKPIPGFRGYEASTLGRVRSFWRTSGSGRSYANGQVRGSWTQIIGSTPRLMKLYVDKDGYYRIGLRKTDGAITKRGVHKLVALAFLPKRAMPNLVPHHLNNVPSDNRLDNLMWATISENKLFHNADSLMPQKGDTHPMARLTAKDVLVIRADNRPRQELARLYQCTPENISRIRTRKTWKHI